MGMIEIYEDWFGSEGFYPLEGNKECGSWREYNDRLGGIEVSTEDVLRAQAWEKATRFKTRRGLYGDPKTRRWLAKIGFYKRWYRNLIRQLRRQA